MSTEQQTEEKALPAVLITPKAVELQITVALSKEKLTLAALEKRALAIVPNEDNLKVMAELLADLDKVEDIAETTFKAAKRPFLDSGQACDKGKKLVVGELERIRGMIKPTYDKRLADIDARFRLQTKQKTQKESVVQDIEDSVLNFTNRIVAATSRKALTDVERLINLERSASWEKKYGEFHKLAIARYEEVLIPVIKDQKAKVERRDELMEELGKAIQNNDPEKMDEINDRIDELTNEMLQNHALVQQAALTQKPVAVIEAQEILPPFKVKRTNYTFEIADLEVALKKSRDLLTIAVDNKACRVVKDQMVEQGLFNDQDEVIVDGIKYIATKEREAL